MAKSIIIHYTYRNQMAEGPGTTSAKHRTDVLTSNRLPAYIIPMASATREHKIFRHCLRLVRLSLIVHVPERFIYLSNELSTFDTQYQSSIDCKKTQIICLQPDNLQ